MDNSVVSHFISENHFNNVLSFSRRIFIEKINNGSGYIGHSGSYTNNSNDSNFFRDTYGCTDSLELVIKTVVKLKKKK